MKFCMHKTQKKASDTEKNTRKARNDILFISAVLLITAVAALALFLFRPPGDTVIVTVDGVIRGEYPLSENRSVEIRNGDGYNLLIIEDGKAYVQHASCPDGICSAHRPVGRNGESIICLPNKVVIEIRTQNQKEPDIVA